ncbi:unnamed protein product [Caenorhabditis brenneri]
MNRVFEREKISETLLNLKWTKHIAMGCDETKKGHLEDISALDIDDGDQMLLLGSHSGSVSVVKYKYLGRDKWKKPMTLKLEKHALKSIKWCPIDLRLFMVTTASNWMRVCDSTMEKVISGKQFEGDVHFHWNEHNTSNSKVAVADGSRTAKIVDFRVGMSLPQIIRWDDIPIDVVQWFPSKHHYLYTGRRDGKIGIFDIRSTRGALTEKRIHRGAPIFEMRITPDGSRLITADHSGLIHVADTWDFSTKHRFQGHPSELLHRRPSMDIFNVQDLFVAMNLDKLTVIKFPGGSETLKNPESNEIQSVTLWDKPLIFRKTSYEVITGHNYNYLNVLSYSKSTGAEEQV